MTNSREYALIWDHKNDNPNGDMRNMNKPRRDDITGQLEIRPARIKRYIRDEWIGTGHNVLVKMGYDDEDGSTLSCENTIKPIKEEVKEELSNSKSDDKPADKKKKSSKSGKDEESGSKKAIPGLRAALLQRLLDNYIDTRLFGVVVTDASKELGSMCTVLGPLHVGWGKSVNTTEAKAVKGTSCFSSGDEVAGGNVSNEWVVPYSLFKASAVFNGQTAERQGINVTEVDLDAFRTGFINGLTNFKSTSKNPTPRMFVEVISNNHAVAGELSELVDAVYDCNDETLRSISQVTFDLAKLSEYGVANKAGIEKVNLYVRRGVNYINADASFNIIIF
ncbi:CRISPR-associated protein, Csh2 family [Methanosarcina lacustris Z-7289]|uniref:CRISPR-associated protein, Csh2 family n=1 Tax=Methanosarcina lacustris Z-7289 TaxID=1434111 RepID=A0A0E3S5W0_9EURY|nr:type I-B CRISPR-associated protein Cas7/Csh2 [Methanosarcina lacustris]AKB75791.1 CRISPR-associated protein, Csh2 family [Methanosarcina lacustris Z-7289]